MACFMVLAVWLLVLWAAQQSQSRIIELTKFHSKPSNVVEVTLDHEDGQPGLPAATLRQVLKRQASGQPTTDGVHEFHDGHYRARIYYPGGGSQVILVLTYDWTNSIAYRSNLYRSINYGNTFGDIGGQVNNAVLYQRFYTNGSTLIFVGATSPQLFYSNNQGATFTIVGLFPSTLVTTSVVYHPTRDGWMLMKDQSSTLYVTEDYGSSWANIAPDVDTFQWADVKWDSDNRRIYFNSSHSILYTADYPYSGGAREFDSNLGTHLMFAVVGRYIFAQRTDNGLMALYVSDMRGPFKKAHIPIPGGHQSYLVSHIDDMQAMVIVEHAGGFYNLYLSDESGLYFSLSLRDIVIQTRSTGYQIDLELIEGLNGTLIANQYAREDVADRAFAKRTVISYDNGGIWMGLLPPDEDVSGNAINCEPPNCTLHLHMDTSYYARLGVYSTESAPGIIVAHGNTGATLRNLPDLYISRDGGITWEQTLAGSWGVNLADHGGLMVAARDYHQEPSTVLKYSCNEGYSWNDFQFIDYNITVFGVITEPGHHTTVASLYGGPWGTGVPFEWIVVTVDFAGIFDHQCEDDDYYDWRPWDVRSDSECVLGSSIIIERRRPQVCCLNGREYDREFGYRICECTIEDYECDYGYGRLDLDSLCMRDNFTVLPNPCGDGKTKTYLASTGYRKIGGDVCSGGEEDVYQPYTADCCEKNTQPPTPGHSTSAGESTAPPIKPTSSSDSTSQPLHPPTTEAGPHTHPSPAGQRSEGDKGSERKVVALAVLLVLACLATGVVLVLFFVVSVKYRTVRQKYIRVLTAAEPDLLTLKGSAEGDDSLENMVPVVGDDDDDDKPLIP